METGYKGDLTPEQIMALQKHGVPNPNEINSFAKKQPVQQQVQQPQQVQQQVKTVPPVRNIRKMEKPITKRQEEVEEVYNNNFYEDSGTYFKIEEEEIGSMELDLISYREKGREERYLNIVVDGFREEDYAPVRALFSIGSKDSFEKFKNFVSKLNWED
jgi:hypothetical protein